MKNIYFVRHGQTVANSGKTFQGATEELSEKGRDQAQTVAERFTRIPIDIILSSTYVRAHDTAKAIHAKTKVPLEMTDLAVERKRPSIIHGKSHEDKDAKLINATTFREGWLARNPRHSDEETFDDVIDRARKLKKLLEERSEENIVVVSHGGFKRMFLAYILFGEDVTPQEMFKIYDTFEPSNTGITLYHYDPDASISWKLVCWNDHAHLG